MTYIINESSWLVETKRQTNCLKRKYKNVEFIKNKENKESEEKKVLKERVEEFENQFTEEFEGEERINKTKFQKDDNFTVDNIDVEKRSLLAIPQTATASIRYNVSLAGTAAIASGFLYDLIDNGYLPEDHSFLAVDLMKVHRAKHKVMHVMQRTGDQSLEENKPSCIMFDGRIDQTKVKTFNEETGRYYETVEKEDHYSVTDENGLYLTHITKETPPENSKPAQSLALQIFDWLCQYGIDESLKVVAGDSTNGNTGADGGHFAWLEHYLGHKLHWLICQLHTNELPLRVLITLLVGVTKSNSGFAGIIGEQLPKASDLARNFEFDAISGGLPMIELSEDVSNDLSTDQKYAYNMMRAIRSGELSKELSLLNPGKICHSRWLTTANTFCLLYCSNHNLTPALSKILKDVVTYIVLVYYPAWFQIKVHHNWLHGPANVLYQLELLKTLPKHIQKLVEKNVRRSAWFAHSECILVTLLKSGEEDRAWAVNKIIQIRGESLTGNTFVFNIQ